MNGEGRVYQFTLGNSPFASGRLRRTHVALACDVTPLNQSVESITYARPLA